MLSKNLRLKVEKIANRISNREEVSLADMTFIQKAAKANHSAQGILDRARRKAFQGKPEEGSLDELLHGLNLGIPDPSSHLTSDNSVDDLAEFFKQDKPEDWRQRD